MSTELLYLSESKDGLFGGLSLVVAVEEEGGVRGAPSKIL